MSNIDDEEYESFDLDDAEDDSVPAPAEDAEDDDVDSEEDDDDDDDELEDAAEDEIDFVVATYREDGQPLVAALSKDLANDLEELVVQLRRLPADAGSLGFVSLVEEVFVLVRVRGPHVQVLLSDATAAADWPIARDVADFFGAEVPDPDDEPEPLGDLNLLADLGLSELDLTAIIDNLDLSSDQMLIQVADKIKIGPEFRRVVEAAMSD